MTIELPHVIRVAIARPLAGYFDYECATLPARGARVVVPFGRSTLLGVCAGAGERREGMALKAVEKVLDDAPVLGDEVWALVEFAARYYQYPVGEVAAAALPVALRKGGANVRDLPLVYALTDAGVERLAARLGEKQRRVLQWFSEHG
ncbi:MAG: hypothetical protein Q4D61_02680, partial [Cardiobacteriaceae bacterium]|nr:hypothetical protein [Cardiobacteriaceae bacterium]